MEFVKDDSNVQELERSPSAKDTHLCYDSLLNRECNQSSNLTSLCLSGSYAFNLRHFRLMLPNIRELSVNCCKLKNLDGLSNFPYLQTLNASSNNINDLYPCVYLENIKHIDLQRNEISDISNVEYLALCSKLESVALLKNPLCFDVKNEEMQVSSTYCTQIANLIPNLKYLDGYDLSIVCQHFLTDANQPSHIHYQKDLYDNSSSLQGIEAFKEYISVPTRSSTDILESVNSSHAYSSFCELISQEYCFLPTPLHSSKCFTSIEQIYCGSPGQAFRSSCCSKSITGPDDESRKFLRNVSGVEAIDTLPEKMTMNGQYYTNIALPKMVTEMKEQLSTTDTSRVLLPDNANAHKNRQVMAYLEQEKISSYLIHIHPILHHASFGCFQKLERNFLESLFQGCKTLQNAFIQSCKVFFNRSTTKHSRICIDLERSTLKDSNSFVKLQGTSLNSVTGRIKKWRRGNKIAFSKCGIYD